MRVSLRRRLVVIVACAAPLLAVFVSLFLPRGGLPAHVLVVSQSGSSTGDGKSWATAFAHPARATAAASVGTEIWIAAGTYANRDAMPAITMKEGVSFYGGFAGDEGRREEADPLRNPTVLEGSESSPHVVLGASRATLSGFVVKGGASTGTGPEDAGGGMRNESVSDLCVTGCVFIDNVAPTGGGIANIDSSLTIVRCVFARNEATHWAGGGIYNKKSAALIEQCTFDRNKAPGGGGVYNDDGSDSTISRCVFTNNTTIGDGGAICNLRSSPGIVNCVFENNTTRYTGGAVCSFESAATIAHCTFHENAAARGGAVCNCTKSHVALSSSVLWGNTASGRGADIFSDDGSSCTVRYSCLTPAYPGDHNIAADPMLSTGPEHRLRPGASSPCIDAADPESDITRDITGSPRPAGAGPDMGAYERRRHISD